MDLKKFRGRFENALKEIDPVIGQSLGQILQREVSLKYNIAEESNLNSALMSAAYPVVTLFFHSGTCNKQQFNLVLLPVPFVAAFYAWMISGQPDLEISDEHLEGLKEAVDQVFGQVKMAVADDTSAFVMDKMEIKKALRAEEAVARVAEGLSGIRCDYEFNSGSEAFKIGYYCWTTIPDYQEDAGKTEAKLDTTNAQKTVHVQPAEFGDIGVQSSTTGEPVNVDMLLDVDLEISVELDRKIMLVSDLLKLGKGSIIELEKSAGEPLDIFVNGRKFAEGEVVVIDDRFGIRLTQLLNPKDRMKSLGS